jgi:hypothetical protein
MYQTGYVGDCVYETYNNGEQGVLGYQPPAHVVSLDSLGNRIYGSEVYGSEENLIPENHVVESEELESTLSNQQYTLATDEFGNHIFTPFS